MKMIMTVIGTVTALASILSTIAGLGALNDAFLLPKMPSLSAASGAQATQIYAEASYWALLGIGALIFAGLCASSVPRVMPRVIKT